MTYHIIKHLLRLLIMVIRHFGHHAVAVHAATAHGATAHAAARHATTLAGTRSTVGYPAVAAMPGARTGTVPFGNTAAALRGFNQQSNIMASVGQEQAAAIPDVGDFSYDAAG